MRFFNTSIDIDFDIQHRGAMMHMGTFSAGSAMGYIAGAVIASMVLFLCSCSMKSPRGEVSDEHRVYATNDPGTGKSPLVSWHDALRKKPEYTSWMELMRRGDPDLSPRSFRFDEEIDFAYLPTYELDCEKIRHSSRREIFVHSPDSLKMIDFLAGMELEHNGERMDARWRTDQLVIFYDLQESRQIQLAICPHSKCGIQRVVWLDNDRLFLFGVIGAAASSKQTAYSPFCFYCDTESKTRAKYVSPDVLSSDSIEDILHGQRGYIRRKYPTVDFVF
jgi:hypothetical protein